MILLKSTVLFIGLMSPTSISVSHTEVSSLPKCERYLSMEADRLRGISGNKVELRKKQVSTEYSILGYTAIASMECIEVK